MVPNDIPQIDLWQGNPLSVLARVRGVGGAYVLTSSLSSITYTVWDVTDNPAAEVTSGSIAVAGAVFNTLQTAFPWTADQTGYNFAWAAPNGTFPNAPKKYRVEITFTDTSGNRFRLVVLVSTKPLLTSPL